MGAFYGNAKTSSGRMMSRWAARAVAVSCSVLAPGVVLGALTAGTSANTAALSETGCFATTEDGGWGFCGPVECNTMYRTCQGPATVGTSTGSWANGYAAGTCEEFIDNSALNKELTDPFSEFKGNCDATCTQVKTGVCSSEALAKIVIGDGVKYAYCNDLWLVIGATGETGVYESNLNDVPHPPGGTGGVTGELSKTTSDKVGASYIPIAPTALSTSAATNNLDAFDVATGVGQYSYLSNSVTGEGTYGLPSDSGVGVGANGAPIYPLYNNVVQKTPDRCEVDRCNEHVGQGGGQPHWHGDPFGDETTTTCLYGPSDYVDADGAQAVTNHPPIIGFSFDGYRIYGRYLSESAPGFAAPLLDACGGHTHATATDKDRLDLPLGGDDGYHYHAQIFDHACSGTNCVTTNSYTVSTPGPYQCWKADIAKETGSSALMTATASASYLGQNDMHKRCCEMTDFYVASGLDYPIAADLADGVSATAGPTPATTAPATPASTPATTPSTTPATTDGDDSGGSVAATVGVVATFAAASLAVAVAL